MNKTTIKIPKGRFDKRVPVSVNGRIAHINVDQETEVGDHILEALNHAGIEYTVVSPKGGTDGSGSGVGSEPSTTATGTATRLDPAIDDSKKDEDGSDALLNPAPAPGENAGDSGAKTDAETDAEEPGPLDQSIPDLTAHLETVDDPATIDALIAAETAGNSRIGALEALNARKAALSDKGE